MLCSISTGKSGSKWLDRLRSSKGFPAGNDLDLEQFLNHQNPNVSNSSDAKLSDANIGPKSNSISAQPCERPENDEKEWLGIMSNVLSELFYTGDSDCFPRINGKKSSRKQANPRICILSTFSNVETENGASAIVPSSGDNSCAEIKQASDPIRLMKEENVNVDVDVEEDEKSYADLSAFSRTDVTVIDSSCPVWKCEKLLFRRKNVWRVREKKTKSTKIGTKKRKANSLEEESAAGEKKLRRCPSSTKDAYGEAHKMTSNNVHPQSDNMSKGHEERTDFVGPVPKKRFPRKSQKSGPSVVLIKSVPTSKKTGANIPKGCLHS
ncbi:uncharacterized protein LOC130765951 [Actinidia eriantha]|uniref:uncharacterized protein LOC130765951 n=1 Tax=Actinidia eriantha TaxID=165200 RepID=UPI00258DBBA1|nr:uncharacterized protein LOC130765951 [Actinidia eriantha]